MKKTYHYYCKHCSAQVYSKFCFEEKTFNNEYFAEMMKRSREKKHIKIQNFQKFVLNSRSDIYSLNEEIELEDIEGLTDTLNSFIESPVPVELIKYYLRSKEFDMKKYRDHIIASFSGYEMFFDKIPALIEDIRKDKIFRFITLIFMAHNNEVVLTQYNDRILVEKSESLQ